MRNIYSLTILRYHIRYMRFCCCSTSHSHDYVFLSNRTLFYTYKLYVFLNNWMLVWHILYSVVCCQHGQVWQYKYNVTLYILLLLLLYWIWVFFSFMSGMGCYVLNILLSSPSRTVFLLCCLVKYSALAVGSGTIPHQTTL